MGCGASFCKSTASAAPPGTHPSVGAPGSKVAPRGEQLQQQEALETSTPMSSNGDGVVVVDLVGYLYQRRFGAADGEAWGIVGELAKGEVEGLRDLEPIDWNGMWSHVSGRVVKLMGGVETLEVGKMETVASALLVTELANDAHYFPFELLFRGSNKADDAVRLMRKLAVLSEAFLNIVGAIGGTEEFRRDGAAVGAGVYCRRIRADCWEHRVAKEALRAEENRLVCLVEVEPGWLVWGSALVGVGEEVGPLRMSRGKGEEEELQRVLVFRSEDTCHEACVLNEGQKVDWTWAGVSAEDRVTVGSVTVEGIARPSVEEAFEMARFPYALKVGYPRGILPHQVGLKAREALRRQRVRGGSTMVVCKAALREMGLPLGAIAVIVAEELRRCREEQGVLEVNFMQERLVPWCVFMVGRACKYTARRYGNILPGKAGGSAGGVSYGEALFCVLFNTALDGRFSPSDDPAAIAASLYVMLAVMLSIGVREAPPPVVVVGLALLDPPELLRAMSWELRMALPEATVEKTLLRRRGRRPGIWQAVEGAVLEPEGARMIELEAMLRPSKVYTVRHRPPKGLREPARAAVKVHEALGVRWIQKQLSGVPLEGLVLACCLPSSTRLPKSRSASYRERLLVQGAWSAAREKRSAGVLACFPTLSRSVLALRPTDPELIAGLWCVKGIAAASNSSPELSAMLLLQALAMLVGPGGYGDPRYRLGKGERIVAWLAWRLGLYAYAKGAVLKVEKYGDIFRACGEDAKEGMSFAPPRLESGPLERAESAEGLTGPVLGDEEVDEVLASSMEGVDVERLPWAMDLSKPCVMVAFQQGSAVALEGRDKVATAPVLSDTQEVTRGTCFAFGSDDRNQLGVRYEGVGWMPRPVRLMSMKGRRLMVVSAGDGVSAAVCDEGRLYVWGSGFPEVRLPRLPHGVVIEAVSCAASAVVALSEDGRLWQVGDLTASPTSSRVGRGEGVVEVSLGGGCRATTVGCGSYHAVAIDGEGRLWAWGRGEGGQLGIEKVEAHYDVQNDSIVTRPMMLTSGVSRSRFASVACGEAHTAAVTIGGQLYCWGWGEFGQLGLGFSAETFPPGEGGNSCRCPTPEVVEVGTEKDGVVGSVACGGAFTACLTTLGDVWAWGSNESGQLALPPGAPLELTCPRKVTNFPPGKRFKALSCGFAHALAIDSQGQVYSWGSDCYGQLGRLNPPPTVHGSWLAAAPPRRSQRSCQYVPSVIGSIGAVRMGACSAGYGHSLLLSDPGSGGGGSSCRRRSEASSVSRFG
ncbi:regulator of chromosome condensation, putative [Perkinsus marinus ATCC 50983]|uniref:Regulator of chromosome condensation, putative n=1 Tax=Perkinsus marinus (strain ATCC 50983 / TXsc) TaxID=423536 RepID=C5LT76_PERM5|nr:regulator of chromosome condensation, putative [Perkinsus marinus ATCC 50983]EER00044.1 regulator of chromosome condensation, putative [Perkinsus marinus ATCC 50983]|eukprot:XP_002767326.1 regulator of chromosome condensation, putative [Perkinsus marinus ATCC 50983]